MADERPVTHLGRRAARVRADGSRGLLARWALAVIGWLAPRTPFDASELLRIWLTTLDERAWELLQRPRPYIYSPAKRALAAAVDPQRHPASRAALGVFCVAHGLLPGCPQDQAVFYVLTGQHARHRAADPDGSSLAVGYQAADEPTRAALRQSLAGSADLDLVRVIAGGLRRPSGGAPAADETSYLTGQLAGRRAWAELWDLAAGLPLTDASAIMPRFPSGWRPLRQRGLFSVLAAADREQVTRARAALGPLHLQVSGSVRSAAFSPDGRRLAVQAGDIRLHNAELCVFEIPSGRLISRSDDVFQTNSRVMLDLGDAVLCYVDTLHRNTPINGLWRLSGDGLRTAEPVWPQGTSPDSAQVMHRPPGFVALCDWRNQLRIYTTDVLRPAADVSLERLGLGQHPTYLAAASPDGRLLALAQDVGTPTQVEPYRLSVVDTAGAQARVVAQVRSEHHLRPCCFAGPDRVVVLNGYERGVRLFELAGPDLLLLAGNDQILPGARATGYSRFLPEDGPFPVPVRSQVAFFAGAQMIRYLDLQTLAPAGEAPVFPGREGRLLCSSPDGRCHVLGGDGFAGVLLDPLAPLAAEVADRPQASMTPADLATVTAALRDRVGGPGARPLLELLAACLEQRFGDEVAIGGAGPAPAGATDVALD